MVILSKFSETLNELIFDNGLTAKSLAEALNAEPSTITRYLRSERVPSVESLVAIADYFKCSTDFLLGRTEENKVHTFKPCPPFNKQIEFLKDYLNALRIKFIMEPAYQKADIMIGRAVSVRQPLIIL